VHTKRTAAAYAAFAAVSLNGVYVETAYAEEDKLSKFIADGKPIIDVRYRYENVDQAGFADDANASTLRTRLGYQTGRLFDTEVLVEFENVVNIGRDNYNSTTNGNVGFPVVADPEVTELNRAQATFTGLPDTTVIIGRQRLNLVNQRFIGAVGWRQNEQTFDAGVVANKSIPGTELKYGYIRRVHRIFGNDNPFGEFEGDNHFVNAYVTELPLGAPGALVGYGYWLDINEVPTLSTQTLGARYAASPELNDVKLSFAVEYAHQSDRADNPIDSDHDYYAVDANAAFQGLSLGAGYEVLEGDGTTAFQTPLATLHKFQGFADVFLVTPAVGIEDPHGKISYTAKDIGFVESLKLSAWYHDFSSNQGSTDLGTEFDIALAAKLPKGFSTLIKYADYDGAGFSADRQKIWLQLGFKY